MGVRLNDFERACQACRDADNPVCGHFVYAALPPLMGNLVCAVKLAGRIACVTS